jgi:hypothetical protein
MQTAMNSRLYRTQKTTSLTFWLCGFLAIVSIKKRCVWQRNKQLSHLLDRRWPHVAVNRPPNCVPECGIISAVALFADRRGPGDAGGGQRLEGGHAARRRRRRRRTQHRHLWVDRLESRRFSLSIGTLFRLKSKCKSISL